MSRKRGNASPGTRAMPKAPHRAFAAISRLCGGVASKFPHVLAPQCRPRGHTGAAGPIATHHGHQTHHNQSRAQAWSSVAWALAFGIFIIECQASFLCRFVVVVTLSPSAFLTTKTAEDIAPCC